MQTRGAVRALSSTTRSAALQRLGCTEASSREAIRDAYYKRAKACHPDQGGSAAEFRALATAYERALRGDAADAPDATPEHGFAADDPLAVYVRVGRERAAALRRELAEAAKLNSGGLDKGGMWWLAEQMAGEPEEPEAAPRPPKQVGAAAAPPAVFRANDSVWAAMRPGDVMIRLGVTAEKVEELGLTEDRAFVDLAQLDSFTLAGRPFAMVEGPGGVAQLESPIAGVRRRVQHFEVPCLCDGEGAQQQYIAGRRRAERNSDREPRPPRAKRGVHRRRLARRDRRR